MVGFFSCVVGLLLDFSKLDTDQMVFFFLPSFGKQVFHSALVALNQDHMEVFALADCINVLQFVEGVILYFFFWYYLLPLADVLSAATSCFDLILSTFSSSSGLYSNCFYKHKRPHANTQIASWNDV